MKKIAAGILFCTVIACKEADRQQKSNKPAGSRQSAQQKQQSYAECKAAVAQIKQQYKARWATLSTVQKEKIFTRCVAETIAPAWLGTVWNFYGTTETPGKGTIACGYFVTTVLRDAGLPLARIKLAQCVSEEMIRTLVQPSLVQRYSNTAFADFMQAVKKQGYGLYIIGLDNHTGFLYHDGKELYFIHASYIGEAVVIKEPAATAILLQKSHYRVTGHISSDAAALNRWMAAP